MTRNDDNQERFGGIDPGATWHTVYMQHIAQVAMEMAESLPRTVEKRRMKERKRTWST